MTDEGTELETLITVLEETTAMLRRDPKAFAAVLFARVTEDGAGKSCVRGTLGRCNTGLMFLESHIGTEIENASGQSSEPSISSDST